VAPNEWCADAIDDVSAAAIAIKNSFRMSALLY
jgi:hypothetical protein